MLAEGAQNCINIVICYKVTIIVKKKEAKTNELAHSTVLVPVNIWLRLSPTESIIRLTLLLEYLTSWESSQFSKAE